VLVLSLIKSPALPFNTAAQAELAVSYIMLGWWYATLVQMPLGELVGGAGGFGPGCKSVVALAVVADNKQRLGGFGCTAGQTVLFLICPHMP
jgi:hypothetical protein